MRAHDLRLPLIALPVWGVGIAAVLVPALALVCAAACAVMAIALLAVAARWRVRFAAVVAVGLAVAGIVAGQVALAQPARERAAQQTSLSAVHATVTSKVEPASGGGWRWEADAEIAGAKVPIAVFMRDDRPANLDLGSSVSLSGTTAAPFIGQRAAVRVIASAAPAVLRAPGGVFAVAADLRTRFSAVSAQFPGEGAQLVPGLSVGDTTIVTPELTAKMTEASLSHLVAVSGANCAIVTGVAFWLAALCGALRRTRVAVALVVLAGFIVLVTPEPSVVRAGAMSAVAMIALLLGRERLGVPVLSLAVIVLLALDPWLATSIGFALSAAATGALLTLARPLADKLSIIMPRGLALGVAVPLAAQLVCAPIIVLIDPHVSIVGMLANMVAGPAAGIVTILGLVGCLLAVVPWVGFALTALAWAPASWIASVANVAVQVPGGSVPWPDGVAGAVLLAVLTAAAVCIALSRERRARWVSFVVVLSTVVAGVGSVAVRSVIAPHAVPASWAIAQCDVGQGDAIVIRSAGAVAVIDTGLEPQRLSDCLELLAVSRVNVLVLTHFDMDHMGGSSALHGRVDVVMHGPVDDAAAQRRLDDLRDAGAEIVQARLNMTGTLGTAQWRVLWPRDNVQPGNDASVVWEISGGDVPRSLFLGDMSEAGQQQLLATKQVRGPYDVVKVSHHGSADQEPRTYAEAHATIALIGVGKNDYGHPRAETISMLERAGSTVFRTDTAGTITVVREEGGWSVWRQRAPPHASGRAVSKGRRARRAPDRSDPGSARPWLHH